MSSVRRASNRLLHHQILQRIIWIILPAGLIPVVLLWLPVYFYWRSNYSSQSAALLQPIVGLSVFSLLITTLICWLTAQRLTRYVEKLAEAMEKFASGLWDQRAIVRKGDPLAELAMLFNQIADDYRSTYQSLTVSQPEKQRPAHPVIEQVSSLVNSAQSLDDLLRGTLEAIGSTLSSMYASLYLLEEDKLHQQRFLNLAHFYKVVDFDLNHLASTAAGQSAFRPDIQGTRIDLEQIETLNWAVSRAISTGKSIIEEAIPEKGIIEAAIPILRGGQMIGVVDLLIPTRSPDPQFGSFSYRSLFGVEQAVGLLALAVKNFEQEKTANLIDPSRTGNSDRSDKQCLALYQAGNRITQTVTEEEALQVASQTLENLDNPCAILLSSTVNGTDQLQVIYKSSRVRPEPAGNESLILPAAALAERLNPYTSLIITSIKPDNDFSDEKTNQEQVEGKLPRPLLEMAESLGCNSVAFLPVLRDGQVRALMVVGLQIQEHEQGGNPSSLSIEQLTPYRNLIEMLVNSLENIRSAEQTQHQLAELRTFWNISQAISIETDLDQLFTTIHRQLETVLGDLGSFAIALYEAEKGIIHIPFMIEEYNRLEVPSFPLGEGLTSILVQSGKPLLLSDDVEAKSKALGAKTIGEPAKSWLGVPMLYGGEVIGAIIVQDILRTGRFNEDDQRLLSALANEVAVVVHNARLLKATRQQARQERLINEITAKIRRSSDIHTILKTTATELGTALGAQKAHIRLGIEPEQVSEVGGGR